VPDPIAYYNPDVRDAGNIVLANEEELKKIVAVLNAS
jgi:hypothetical protein